MLSLKFENLWKLMTCYTFTINDNINANILCTLCENILIDPYITLCSCRFCKNCLIKYLSKGGKFCPGNTKNCQNELLKIEENVLKDFKCRQNIGKSIFKCPFDSCDSLVSLNDMEEHIKKCQSKFTVCPYQPIGCNYKGTQKLINEHLVNDGFILHSQLFVKPFCELKQGMEKQKELQENREKEIIDRIILIKEDRDRLLEKVLENEVLFKKMQEESDLLKGEIVRLIKEKLNVEKIVGTSITVTDANKEVEKNCEVEMIVENEENCLINNKTTEKPRTFLWKISDFFKNKGLKLSETFVLENYTFRLRVWIGDAYIRLYLCIVRGDFDEFAIWPMMHSVTLTIENQKTDSVHQTAMFQCHNDESDMSSFGRPSDAINDGIGSLVISVTDINNTDGVLLDDSVIVGCIIENFS